MRHERIVYVDLALSLALAVSTGCDDDPKSPGDPAVAQESADARSRREAQTTKTLERALAAEKGGDHATALQLLTSLAASGHVEAQYRAGLLHEGPTEGVGQDAVSARAWYEAAADQGHADAKFRLGRLHEEGRGVPASPEEAVRWYRAAALQGQDEALKALQRRSDGSDVDAALVAYARKEFARAFQILSTLAQDRGVTSGEPGPRPPSGGRGDATGRAPPRRDAAYVQELAAAQYWLGVLHEDGQGVQQDLAGAAKWYDMAAKRGNGDAAFRLASMFEAGRGVAVDGRRAWDLYSAAMARGNPRAAAARERFSASPAAASIGVPQRRGGARASPVGMPDPALSPSPKDAAVAAYVNNHFAWAAEQFLPLARDGDVDAQIYLGHMYESGQGNVSTDLRKAIAWYRRAAEQGDAGAQTWLGWIYRSNRFDAYQRKVDDHAESVRWLRLAAEQGHPDAQLELGNAYREGRGVARDPAQVDRWYKTSHRNREGVGRLLQKPECADVAGVPEFAAVYAACNGGDDGETARQLTLLARKGDARAQNWLGCLYFRGLPGAWPGTTPHPTAAAGDLFPIGARWIAASAAQGFAPGQFNVGVVWEHGMGVAPDLDRARRWYRAAAGQKLAQADEALTRLGR